MALAEEEQIERELAFDQARVTELLQRAGGCMLGSVGLVAVLHHVSRVNGTQCAITAPSGACLPLQGQCLRIGSMQCSPCCRRAHRACHPTTRLRLPAHTDLPASCPPLQ